MISIMFFEVRKLNVNFEEIVDIEKIGEKNHKKLNDILSLANKVKDIKFASEDKEKTLLLCIDFQNDFMENGELGVPNSHKDVENVTKFIYHHFNLISKIVYSLDTHMPHQIFHPIWWKDKDGNHPSPFTIIHAEEVKEGKWIPLKENEKSLQYVENLEKIGKKKLCIWPYHCLEGTFGASLEGQLANMIYFHSLVRQTEAKSIVKGQSPVTEMYGIFKPEYDPDYVINKELLEEISSYDKIFISGEAKSHCVLESLRQLLEYMNENHHSTSKVFVLEDCMSSIPGFEEETEKAFQQLVDTYNINIVKSTDI